MEHLISFLVGLFNGFLVMALFTRKYMPGNPDENVFKFLGYTALIAIPLNILVLKVLDI